jgi:hypothetical protein
MGLQKIQPVSNWKPSAQVGDVTPAHVLYIHYMAGKR